MFSKNIQFSHKNNLLNYNITEQRAIRKIAVT